MEENNNNNNNVNTGLPVTPAAPVLPADQNMPTQELAPAVPIETNINPEAQAIPSAPIMQTTPEISVEINPQETAPVAPPIVGAAANETVQVTPVVETPAAPVQVAPIEAPVQESSQVAPTAALVPDASQAVMPSAPVTSAPQANAVDPMADPMAGNYINPVGDYVDGGKIGNTTPRADSVAVKKSKNNKLILIIIIIVILIAGGLGGFYYYSQYKTTEKRISSLFNGIRSLTSSISNETIEKTSGTYDLDVSLSSDEVNATAKIKGSYKRDLDAKKIDFTMDLEKLNLGEDLITSPINIELYYGDSNIYVLLQNFYSDYIYEEVPMFDEYFNSIQQNDINYQLIITGIESAIESAINAMSKTTSVENVNINGKTVKSNVIAISMTGFNQINGVNAFYRYFLNNESLMTEIAKLNDSKLDDIKSSLEEALNEEKKYEDINATLYIYTSMFKNELNGIKFVYTNDNKNIYFEIYPESGGYKLAVKEDDQNIFDISYSVVENRHLETIDKAYSFTGVFYSEDKANKFNVDLKMVTDVTPKDIKINVKNSVKLEYLTNEAKAEIIDKASKVGPLGLYLPDLLKSVLGVNSEVEQGQISVGTPEVDTPQEENSTTNNCGIDGAC